MVVFLGDFLLGDEMIIPKNKKGEVYFINYFFSIPGCKQPVFHGK